VLIEKIKEGVYLKEKKGDYRIVYPVKKNLDKPFKKGNIHWFNLITGGSWNKLLATVFIVVMIILLAWSYHHDNAACMEIYNDISKTCDICQSYKNLEIYNTPSPVSSFINNDTNNPYYDWEDINLLR